MLSSTTQERSRKKLIENKWATEAELERWDEDVKKEVEEAVKFAESSPVPAVEELYTDVYKTPDYPFIKD